MEELKHEVGLRVASGKKNKIIYTFQLIIALILQNDALSRLVLICNFFEETFVIFKPIC